MWSARQYNRVKLKLNARDSHMTYTFFYKKPVYKKPTTRIAKN